MSNKGEQRKETILVVDDIVENLEVVKRALTPKYRVKAAISGQLAVEIAVSQKPDLILLDILMPEMSGYEVCQQLKAKAITKDIPIIFLTGMDSTHEETQGLKMGAVDYIAKPINPPILKARIKTHLELSKTKKKLLHQKQEIENLYQKLNNEINKAAQIHERNFLAEIPNCEGLSLATHFQPAQRLGGDFYNFIKTGDKLVIYLSDVTGHSLEGVVFNAFVKEAVDSYVSIRTGDIEPEGILRHVYQQYCKNNYPDDYFVCIFLMVLDLQSNELSYSGAGFQNFPLLCFGNGERLTLKSSGPPISLAISPELMDFEAKQITLMSGSTLLFSTDGIVEQANGSLRYKNRLKEAFYNNCHRPPRKIVQTINEDFQSFNNGCQQADDDITYIVLQVD
ncbi:PP2C family protein-serine/threonine phosphatase [Fuchsiella alkaliacetigena]|uniref:PP2C family protein-serine/threonine phosphatase n=1 Tax=Fuchsiella alkaliacetigena TaxID=957042 RepID=UPI00200AA10E|nr:SpoIIE family protein phosphatase [Fuchsiella alkaliacetigena]MCK8824052.1 SpoIIE family protein phosphatase [Fuchsiella alkaliacetigena]